MNKLRECTCEIEETKDGEEEIKKKELEVFCVMDGVWGVLCHECGALSYHGSTKEEGIKLWNEAENDDELQRAPGYFKDGSYEKEAIEMGKQIANAIIDDKE